MNWQNIEEINEWKIHLMADTEKQGKVNKNWDVAIKRRTDTKTFQIKIEKELEVKAWKERLNW